ncbi:hypothetical protein BHE74_00039093 [Ensete ventricosum]|uniref:Uncharacterized protein n=1 Tax=Ensete ventricosum TaxID=4639 RepID=A0A427AFL7_ENSVE|nr:hypothetical protein B296_00017250 [Ensete ventricosum]RWW09269.1 hypothetical protein GW17_00027251 [Ensete ventricosum]RWW54339.1 hypothetical protein BHE74_00039093 [Ensete ventricosum]RZR80373.1 hypothetical protein BHM03_00006401 [Ensete ventricosum]
MAAQDLHCNHFVCCTSKETDVSCQSLGFSSPRLQLEIVDQDQLHHYTLTAMDSSSSTKKLCHNAYERGRRKKINDLYASLRALLPESDQSVQEEEAEHPTDHFPSLEVHTGAATAGREATAAEGRDLVGAVEARRTKPLW